MNGIYQKLGTKIGELVDQKNEAYGSSFAKAGEFLALLYPQGVLPEAMTHALLLVRIFDKMMRIATDQDAFGESPFQDIAGYGLLGAELQRELRARCQESASGETASSESKEQPASAGLLTNQPTTPSVSATDGKPPSPLPANSLPQSKVAIAITVEVSAVKREVALALAKVRNCLGQCGMICNEQKLPIDWQYTSDVGEFWFCSGRCRNEFARLVVVP